MTTYNLFINKIDIKTEEQVESECHTVGREALLEAIDSFGAHNHGTDDEVDLEATDETVRVLLEFGIEPPDSYEYYWQVYATKEI